jgi:hypothetical protein
MLGTNGHHYSINVEDLRDRRVKVAHVGDTTNIRLPNGVRMDIRHGHSMQGTSFDSMRTCRTCNVLKNKIEFCDYAVMERDRRNNSLNIHCRDCQLVKYASGYKQDGFVAANDFEEDVEDDDDDEEDDEEYEVEFICSHRIRNGEYEFLVHWLHYSDEEDTWEPYVGLNHLDILKNYIKRFKKLEVYHENRLNLI